MTDEAKEARRLYLKEWREKNRDHINAYSKEWRKNNPDKVTAAAARYWEKKAASLANNEAAILSE